MSVHLTPSTTVRAPRLLALPSVTVTGPDAGWLAGWLAGYRYPGWSHPSFLAAAQSISPAGAGVQSRWWWWRMLVDGASGCGWAPDGGRAAGSNW